MRFAGWPVTDERRLDAVRSHIVTVELIRTQLLPDTALIQQRDYRTATDVSECCIPVIKHSRPDYITDQHGGTGYNITYGGWRWTEMGNEEE